MILRPPRSTLDRSSAASDVYKRQDLKWFGDDFSGTIVKVGSAVKDLKVGDNVVGMAPYCFRSYVTVHRNMVFRMPEKMTFVEAATLPTVFLTSHYAINELARMEKRESILIYAGTGGEGAVSLYHIPDPTTPN